MTVRVTRKHGSYSYAQEYAHVPLNGCIIMRACMQDAFAKHAYMQHPVVASLLRLFGELEAGEARVSADPKAKRCARSAGLFRLPMAGR